MASSVLIQPLKNIVDQRQFQGITDDGPLILDNQQVLREVTIAFESWGQPNADRSNCILLLHGFSGDSHAAGLATTAHPTPGWWNGLIGPGRAIDTDHFHVLCPNVLGGCHGSTGPASPAGDGRPYGSRFPELTVRDVVSAEQRWATSLGIKRWAAVIGGSLGGMRALEWAISQPEKVGKLIVLATTAACSAENRAFHSTQVRAIQLDPNFAGGDYYGNQARRPTQGLALARAIGRLTYGCEQELNLRFGHGQGEAVEAFLEADGIALSNRFDANSYIVLTHAMGGHDVGKGRGGVPKALGAIEAQTTVISMSTDRLFPPEKQQEIVHYLRCPATYFNVSTSLGHDGFLHEQAKLEPILKHALEKEARSS